MTKRTSKQHEEYTIKTTKNLKYYAQHYDIYQPHLNQSLIYHETHSDEKESYY